MPQVLGLLFAVALVLRAKAQLNLPATPQLFTYDVVKEYPHDPDAFTQGLQFDRAGATEFFWESTGRQLYFSLKVWSWSVLRKSGQPSNSVTLYLGAACSRQISLLRRDAWAIDCEAG